MGEKHPADPDDGGELVQGDGDGQLNGHGGVQLVSDESKKN
jgi:hypothetical protein